MPCAIPNAATSNSNRKSYFKRTEIDKHMELQRTLKKTVAVEGIGLHSGSRVSMKVLPAAPGTGIQFRRVDLPGKPEICATLHNVISCVHATTIGGEDFRISTVEHLMATFAGLGIDNAVVEIDGPEVPAMDGSASIFVYLFKDAGIKVQGMPRRFIEVIEEVTITQNDKKVTFLPYDSFYVDFFIDFPHPVIKSQRFKANITRKTFEKRIAKARTFGFLKEVQMLHENGLALGASLENAVVIGKHCVLNQEGLRFSDEFVRHKVLDIIGDLYLLGAPIRAKVIAEKSGHDIHCKAIKKLLETRSAWRYSNGRNSVNNLVKWNDTVAPAAEAFI